MGTVQRTGEIIWEGTIARGSGAYHRFNLELAVFDKEHRGSRSSIWFGVPPQLRQTFTRGSIDLGDGQRLP